MVKQLYSPLTAVYFLAPLKWFGPIPLIHFIICCITRWGKSHLWMMLILDCINRTARLCNAPFDAVPPPLILSKLIYYSYFLLPTPNTGIGGRGRGSSPCWYPFLILAIFLVVPILGNISRPTKDCYIIALITHSIWRPFVIHNILVHVRKKQYFKQYLFSWIPGEYFEGHGHELDR